MRRRNRLKELYFRKNGGLLVRQELANYNCENYNREATLKIFTEEEVRKATKNYHEKIGEGAAGTIYKGLLPDNTVIAVKHPKSMPVVNELIIHSQINHRNVVRLLGCCLETPFPVLVFEYMNNGTLHDHIHKKDWGEPISWELRMKIAAEIAGALAYLHHTISNMKIVHRDVKTSNVLLDHNYKAKLTDLGSSRLVSEDQSLVETLVQGTLGYLDPEYFQSNILTTKSDVYGFGAVLAELLTGKRAASFGGPEEERNLAKFFVCSVEEGRLDQILDNKLIVKKENYESVKKVADLAKRCLSLRGEERPSMKEVAMRLEGLRIMAKHPELEPKETDHLLGSPHYSNANSAGGSS